MYISPFSNGLILHYGSYNYIKYYYKLYRLDVLHWSYYSHDKSLFHFNPCKYIEELHINCDWIFIVYVMMNIVYITWNMMICIMINDNQTNHGNSIDQLLIFKRITWTTLWISTRETYYMYDIMNIIYQRFNILKSVWVNNETLNEKKISSRWRYFYTSLVLLLQWKGSVVELFPKFS